MHKTHVSGSKSQVLHLYPQPNYPSITTKKKKKKKNKIKKYIFFYFKLRIRLIKKQIKIMSYFYNFDFFLLIDFINLIHFLKKIYIFHL
jgi:hypothetical protein